MIIARMQMYDGSDSCSLRMQLLAASGADVHVDDEHSADSEVMHPGIEDVVD